MTHELHLETTDSSRNKGLALTTADQDESECDNEEAVMLVRKFKKFFSNSRYTNQRNNKERRTAHIKSNLECHKCGSTDNFIKDCPIWKNEKSKGYRKTTKQRKSQQNQLSQSHDSCIGRIREWCWDRKSRRRRNSYLMSHGLTRKQEWEVQRKLGQVF